MRKAEIILILAVILAACSFNKKQEETPVPTSIYIHTSSENYPAANQAVSKPVADGFLGLVKIYVEHGLKDDQGISGTYEAQGTGSIIGANGKYYIVTARHVVIPNPELKSFIPDPQKPDEKITFGVIKNLGSRILIGYKGIEPSAIWLPTDDKLDIALLAVPEPMQQNIVYRSLNAAIYNSVSPAPGNDVEAWGYPAKQSPQTQKLIISDVTPEYFVLNQALLQGYSGGLVLLSNENPQKTIIGIIIRSDDKLNQSTVLSWEAIRPIFDGAINNSSTVKKIAMQETTQYMKASFAFYSSDSFPFTSSTVSSKKWWQIWK